jgi:hypothetical protein
MKLTHAVISQKCNTIQTNSNTNDILSQQDKIAKTICGNKRFYLLRYVQMAVNNGLSLNLFVDPLLRSLFDFNANKYSKLVSMLVSNGNKHSKLVSKLVSNGNKHSKLDSKLVSNGNKHSKLVSMLVSNLNKHSKLVSKRVFNGNKIRVNA